MKMSGSRRGNSAWRIFRWPLLLAVVSLGGLIGALLTDAPARDALWTLAIAVPLPIAAIGAFRR